MEKSLYSSQIKEIIQKHLPVEEFKLFIFGSRASGKTRKWSDIDVGIWGKNRLTAKTLADIEEDLEDSRIPFRVEVVDFSRVSQDFKEIALQSIIKL